VQEQGWRADRVRDADEMVRWRPSVQVTAAGIWAGPADQGHWVVGRPGQAVMRVSSPGAEIALLPLLERPMAQVAADLGVGSLTGHGLGFERVVGAALDVRASGYWAARAIAWLEAGFPAAGYRDGLARVRADRRVAQRARQQAARIAAREFPGPAACPVQPS
jgi:hypothetical protein